MIKVLLFPYAGSPILIDVENSIYEFMQLVEGKIDDFKLNDDLTLIMNGSFDSEVDDYKFQEDYGIFGNFLVVKYSENGISSLSQREADYIKNNIQSLLIKA